MSMASFHTIVATKMVATVVEKWKHWTLEHSKSQERAS